MKLADVSVKRPVLAGVMNAVLMVVGLVAFPTVGIDMLPNVDFPVVTVTSIYPGADPGAIESKVVDKLEEKLNTIGGIKDLRSISLENVGQIIIQFNLDRDVNEAAQDVREKVAEAQRDLPADLEPPVVAKFDLGAEPIISIALAGQVPFGELSRFAEDAVKERLQKIDGVGSIDIIGGRQREIHVWIDRDRLGSYGFTVQELAMALKMQNLDVPGGKIDADGQELVVKTKGEVARVEDIGEIIIADIVGGVIRVRDVATVEDGLEEEGSASLLDGKQAVALVVRKQSGTNTVEVAHKVKRELDAIRAELPASYTLEVPTDNSVFIEESIRDVQFDVLLGALLTVVIILLFLMDWRATLISAIALPTSVVATFGFIAVMGFTFNYMTMLALALSIGMLIDDAIVVIENIHRHLQMGKPPLQAAREATAEIGLAVMATTAAIVAVFLPVATMKGIIGRFFYQFGMTVSFAVGVSLLVSFTLTPMLASRLLKESHDHERRNPLSRFVDGALGGIDRGYRWLLARALRQRAVTIAVALAVLAGSVLLARGAKQEMLPQADRGEFNILFELPAGASLEQSRQFSESLRRELADVPGITSMFTTIGGPPRNQINRGSIHVRLAPHAERAYGEQEAISYLRAKIGDRPPAKIALEAIGPVSGASMGMRQVPVQFNLRGNDLGELQTTAEAIMARLREVGGYVDMDTTYRGGKPELNVNIDRGRAGSLGVPIAVVAMAVRTLVAGEKMTELAQGNDRIDVRVRLGEKYRATPNDLTGIKVRNTFGQLVELGNVVTLSRASGPSEIERMARQRQVSLLANLEGKTLGEAVDEINRVAAEVVPPGVSTSWTGMGEIMKDSFADLYQALILAVLLIYLILAAQFESLIHPFTIMLALPLSVVGAFGALALFDMSLSIFAMIGLILLMGIVTKNGVLLVDYTNTLRSRGMSRTDALLTAGPVRLRPILMTTMATVIGMLPVALARGLGGEMRAPMAVAVIGGLVTSTLLTLLVVPVVYSLLDRFTSRKKFLQRVEDEAPTSAAQSTA